MAEDGAKDKLAKGEKTDLMAFNTPDNAIKALASARTSLRFLTPGTTWLPKSPGEQFEIKASLMLEKTPVAALRFNAEDGTILPKGMRATNEGKPEVQEMVQSLLSEIIKELDVLDGVEFRQSDLCWSVPLAYRNRIVAHMKVSGDGVDVLPYKKTAE